MTLRSSAVLLGLLVVGLLNTGASLASEGYEVAAYYFPGYHADPRNDARLGKGWTEWQLIKAAKPRFPGHFQPKVPLWGYRDESDPRAFEQKIDAAADHGITAFIVDWYWYENAPFLQRALDEGFLKARNRDRLKFALMWANHDWIDIFPAKPEAKYKLVYPGTVDRATFNQATDTIIKHYFSQPNYWKIDGKPYFSIYHLMTLIKGLGGLDKTREALEDFRARTEAAGLPGLHLNAITWGIQSEGIARDADEVLDVLGVDSVTSYCWAHHVQLKTFPATPYAPWAKQWVGMWKTFRQQYEVPYFPTISMGWDASPRTMQAVEFKPIVYPYTAVAVGNTPSEFSHALKRAKAFLDEQERGPKVLVINAWNEWPEGSYLEPDTVNGMKYLQAVRDVFGARSGRQRRRPSQDKGKRPKTETS